MVKEYHKVSHVNQDVTRVDEKEVNAVVEEAKLEAVVKRPKKAKKGVMERMVVALIGPDGLPKVSKYVAKDIIGPAAKNMLFDALSNGLQMLIFKDQPYNGGQRRDYGGGYARNSTNYGGAYRSSRTSGRQVSTRKAEEPEYVNDPNQAQVLSHGTILDDYILNTQIDAINVLDAMKDYAAKYGRVKVANYYELIGIPTVYTDNNFGWHWDSIERTRIKAARGGYVIDFAPVEVM